MFASPLQPILSKFAPVRRRTPLRPGPVQARYRWLSSVGHTQDLPGSWGIRPIPLPRSKIPASSSALAFSARRCSPHFADNEDTGTTEFSRLNHAASVPAAYASSDALPHPHARLASGRWLAFAGRESNPLDSIEKFPSSTPDFLLSQAYPGATTKLPQSPGAAFRPTGALFKKRSPGISWYTPGGRSNPFSSHRSKPINSCARISSSARLIGRKQIVKDATPRRRHVTGSVFTTCNLLGSHNFALRSI